MTPLPTTSEFNTLFVQNAVHPIAWNIAGLIALPIGSGAVAFAVSAVAFNLFRSKKNTYAAYGVSALSFAAGIAFSYSLLPYIKLFSSVDLFHKLKQLTLLA